MAVHPHGSVDWAKAKETYQTYKSGEANLDTALAKLRWRLRPPSRTLRKQDTFAKLEPVVSLGGCQPPPTRSPLPSPRMNKAMAPPDTMPRWHAYLPVSMPPVHRFGSSSEASRAAATHVLDKLEARLEKARQTIDEMRPAQLEADGSVREDAKATGDSATAMAPAAPETADTPVVTLGCATGRTPVELYRLLTEDAELARRMAALAPYLRVVNLDEIVGTTKYKDFMRHHFIAPLVAMGMPAERAHIPRGLPDGVDATAFAAWPNEARAAFLQAECKRYEALMMRLQVAVWILGIGPTHDDGGSPHLGFAMPGTPFDSQTHVAQLDDTTQKHNRGQASASALSGATAADGPVEVEPVEPVGPIEPVEPVEPDYEQGITVGLGTLWQSGGDYVLLAFGDSKRRSLEHALLRRPNEAIPASVLQLFKKGSVEAFVDAEAWPTDDGHPAAPFETAA